jgi:hypothetical protein
MEMKTSIQYISLLLPIMISLMFANQFFDIIMIASDNYHQQHVQGVEIKLLIKCIIS